MEIFLEDDRVESFKEYRDRVELRFTKDYSDGIDGTHLFTLVSDRSYDIKIKYLNQQVILTFSINEDWVQDLIYILENLKERKQ